MLARKIRVEALLYSFLFVNVTLLLGWLILQPVPPLQNYVGWVYQGWIGAQLLHHQPEAMLHFALVHYPVPNSMSQVLLAALTAGAGAFVSAKLVIGVLVAGYAVVCCFASRRLHVTSPGAISLVGFCLLGINSAFWDGYVNYQFSLLILLLFLMRPDRSSPIWISIFGIILFFCHASTLFAFVVFVAFSAVIARHKVVSSLVALSPSMVLLIWYLIGKSKGPAMPHEASAYKGLVSHLEYKVYTLSKLGPFHNLVDYNLHSLSVRSHTLYIAGVILNLVFALLLLSSSPTLIRLFKAEPPNPFLLAAALLFLCFIILPGMTLGVVNLGERLLYPCILFAFFAMKRLPLGRWMAIVTVCGMTINSAQLFTLTTVHAGSPAAEAGSRDPAFAGSQDFVNLVFTRASYIGPTPIDGFLSTSIWVGCRHFHFRLVSL